MFDDENRVHRDEVAALYEGHEVAVHTFSHPSLDTLTDAEIVDEVLQDRKNLEAITGGIVRDMAYPNGLWETVRVPAITAVAGVVYARTTNSTHQLHIPQKFMMWYPTCHHNDAQVFELIDRLFEPERPYGNRPRLLYIWGHSYEFNNQQNWDRLEAICARLSGHEEVWYATNIEIYDYVTAYNSLIKSADGHTLYNPTVIDLYACVYNRNITIPAGQMVKI